MKIFTRFFYVVGLLYFGAVSLSAQNHVEGIQKITTADDIEAPAVVSRGNTQYTIDPVNGDDANPIGRPWKTFTRINNLRLAPGDEVVIVPGMHSQTLMPTGSGTQQNPIVIRFLPGVHRFGVDNALRLPMYVSNSCDSPDPKPIGIYIRNTKYMRIEGGGVSGPDKTLILYGGRMVQIFNDNSEDITYSGLVLDLQRPTVSEFYTLEVGARHAVIQVAEQSDYVVSNNKFNWTGDWGPGKFCQVVIPAEGKAKGVGAPPGWNAAGQIEATATDLGQRRVRLEFLDKSPGLNVGWHYRFRSTKRHRVGIHNARCARITFKDCDVYALSGMGFVSQFTDTITYLRVNVTPPQNTLRTCPAWADIFQFSNCKGDILVEDCKLSGSQDDAINCHGTYLRVAEQSNSNQLLVRYVHSQTYGFAPYVAGDEIAVMSPATMREYPDNPRGIVTAVEKKSDTDWLITLKQAIPQVAVNDILDNITWNPNITVRNNTVSYMPARGFLFATRGKIVVENNTFNSCAKDGLLIEGDASFWMESSPIRDMLIKNNNFIDCGITIHANVKNKSPDAPVHENIRIIENKFERGRIRVNNTKGLIISGNTFTPKARQILIDQSCADVKVENNF